MTERRPNSSQTRASRFLRVLAALTLASTLAVGWRESLGITNPRDYRHPLPVGSRPGATPLSAHGLAYEEMLVTAPDGSAIRGWLVPASGEPRKLAIVALHGRSGNRESLMPLLPLLHGEGASVALIDLRENGLSDGRGRGTGLGMREAEDALAAAADLRRRGYRKIVLCGCSLGASASLIAAAHDPGIAGVIADSAWEGMRAWSRDDLVARLARHGMAAPSSMTSAWAGFVVGITRVRLGLGGLEDPIDVIEKIAPRPVLLVQGGSDESVPLSHGQRLAARAGANARLLTIPEAGHCAGFQAAPDAYSTEVRRLLTLSSTTSPP
jgi:pimeloyl-ACP methyl ester carboxylesterase